MEIYNWDENSLNVEDKNGNKYSINLRGNKNVVHGYSGTGKTHLINIIKKIQDSMNDEKYSADNIVIVNKRNKKDIGKCNKKIFIIDSADVLLNYEDVQNINSDTANRYLVYTRVAIGLDVSPNHYGEFVTDGKTTKIKYTFNVRGWR